MIGKLRLDKYSALYLWALFMIVFWFASTEFMTWTTLHLQLTEYTMNGILALAFLVPLATGTFDLSIGAVAALSLVGSAVLTKTYHWNPVLSMLVMIAVCALLGAVSGWFVVKMRINSFIATLGMSQIATSLALKLGKGENITGAFPDWFRKIGTVKWFGQERYVYVFFLLAVIIWFIFEHTPTGRYMFATGGNPEAARLAGVKTDRLVWSSLIASAAIAALVGVVYSWKVGNASTSIGPGYLFPAIAAVFFGASQIKGRANVWGAVIALFCLAWGIKGLQLAFPGSQLWVEPLFQGTSLLAAVSLAARSGVIKIRRKKAVPTEALDTPVSSQPTSSNSI
jgi:ribose transport system permease protein